MKRMNFPGRRLNRRLQAEIRQGQVKPENTKKHRLELKKTLEETNKQYDKALERLAR